MTKIFAHRGSRINRPENTLAAFEEALRVGADGIELDVQLSKDREVVVIHDTTVDRTTDGTGAVESMTVDELQLLDAGSWFDPSYSQEKIPTLAEVFELLERFDFTGYLNIELKTAEVAYQGIEEAIQSLVEEKTRDFSILYSSFSLRSLYKMHRLDPQAEIAYLASESNFWLWLGGLLPFVKTLHLSRKWYFQKKRKIRKTLRLWTMNDERQMVKAFKRGIDGIITDKPELALALRRQLEYDTKKDQKDKKKK